MFWIERPARTDTDSGCCPISPPEGEFDCFSYCCSTEIEEAPPIRALYDYLGKGPKFRVVKFRYQVGVDRSVIRCGVCDTSETAGVCCGSGPLGNEGCVCDPDGQGKNVSPYQKQVMEQFEAYWLALDILCYDDGASLRWSVSNDSLMAYEPATPCPTTPYVLGTLWGHTLAIVHKEHWYRFADCGETPNPYPELTEPNGEGTPFQCIGPKHWIYACSGAPLFDFDLDDAVERGKITEQDRCDLYQQLTADWSVDPPSQAILAKLCNAGYFDTRDWREVVRQEWQQLKDRFPEVYTGSIPTCDSMDPLGPVRRRLWRVQNVPGSGGSQWEWVRLERTKARTLDIQIPASWDLDPWNGGPYPVEGDADYDDFVFWADRQYVYFHARPGGWDWTCWDAVSTGGGVGSQEDDLIPHILRRDSDICGGDCITVSGFPRDYTVNDCGGTTPPTCDECTSVEQRACGSGACPQVGCDAQDYCLFAPENGGRNTPCEDVMIAANCDGIHFRFTRIRFVDTGEGSACDAATWRYAPKCEVLNHAYLFTLQRQEGNYGIECPFYCRDLTVPQSIADAVPNVYDSLLAYRGVCAAIQAGCTEATMCCGTFCIPIIEDGSGCCDGHTAAEACDADPPGEADHPCA